MKKLIVLLLALVMVGAVSAQAAAPAPTLTLSGAIYGGVVYRYDGATKIDSVKWTRNYGATGYDVLRARVNGTYGNDVIGAKVRWQTNDPTGAAPTFTQAFGWYKFLDKKLTAYFGKLGDYTFATAYNSFGNMDGADGALLVAEPISGLQVGGYIPVVAAGSTSKVAFEGSNVGLAYNVKDIGKFVAAIDFISGKKPTVTAGANITAIKDLSVVLEYRSQFSDPSATAKANTYLDQKVYYTMDKLTVGAYIDEYYEHVSKDLDFTVTPDVSYQVSDPLSVGASVTVGFGTNGFNWSLDPYGALAVKNGEMAFGAGYNSDKVAKLYIMNTFNF